MSVRFASARNFNVFLLSCFFGSSPAGLPTRLRYQELFSCHKILSPDTVPAMPKSKKQPANAAPEILGAELPELKAEALLSLTNRIEANFNKSPFKNPDKAQLAQPKKERKKASKKSDKLPLTAIDTPSVSKSRRFSNDSKPQLSSIPNAQLRGKKRLRDGKIKGLGNNESIVKDTQREGKVSSTAQSGLEEDVLALGGTRDDYKLVEGAPSDSEIEGDDKEPMKGSHVTLGQDVFQFVKDLRIGKVNIKELGSSESEQGRKYIHDRKKHLQLRTAITPSKSTDEPRRPEGKKVTNRASSQLVGLARQQCLSGFIFPLLMPFLVLRTPIGMAFSRFTHNPCLVYKAHPPEIRYY